MASQPFQLVMRTGPNPGEAFPLTKNEIYIGRDINNDIAINDQEVSRKHARLVKQAGGYVLEDLGSTNGTYVNGQRLMGPHVLRPGETVMLGENVSLVLETGYDADATVVTKAPPIPSQEPAPPPRETYIPPAQPPATTYPPQPAQVIPSQAEPYYEPPQEAKKDNRTLIVAGCGCLIVMLCILVAGGIVFDTLNLYCTPPFDALSPLIYTCP